MTTIFERVTTALNTLSPAIPFSLAPFEQVGDAALPAQFITFQLITGYPEQHADNAETLRTFLVQINIMSTSGLAVLPNVTAALIAAGFFQSQERMLPKNEASGHFILSKDFTYLETT